MFTPTRVHLLAVAGTIALATLTLSGCAPSTDGDSIKPNGADLKVVATTTQVADFTRIVGGKDASVTQLIQPNQSAHSFDPSAADLAALGAADVLVINGLGLEEWLDDAIEASGFEGTTIDASEGIGPIGADADAHGEGDHAEEEHSDDDGHSEEEHAEEEHDHSAGNPHIWTDPSNARVMVENIQLGLDQAAPELAGSFDANAVEYVAQLEALDTWIAESINQVPESSRLLVSNHDVFPYFNKAYGITYIGAIMPGFDDNAEPSVAQVDELVALIKSSGVKAVFSENSIDPKLANTIADEAGVTVFSGEDALYGDSLGIVGSDGESYLGSQIHNLTLILESWGAKPLPLPEMLQ